MGPGQIQVVQSRLHMHLGVMDQTQIHDSETYNGSEQGLGSQLAGLLFGPFFFLYDS